VIRTGRFFVTAAIRAPAVPSPPVLPGPRAKPTPGHINRHSEDDPVKRAKELAKRRRLQLEPVNERGQSEQCCPDAEELTRSPSVNHSQQIIRSAAQP
jgi:hypothetical protein